MQSLEEQSFDLDDGYGLMFDIIIVKSEVGFVVVVSNNNVNGIIDMENEGSVGFELVNINVNVGIDRMENDIKMGGFQCKGDCDDFSVVVFGEVWEVKKEWICKFLLYGWMKNWDFMSVIIKIGFDLRQEVFVCQLI